MKKINSIVCFIIFTLCINFSISPPVCSAKDPFDLMNEVYDNIKYNHGAIYAMNVQMEACGLNNEMLSISNDQVFQSVDDELDKYGLAESDKRAIGRVIKLRYMAFQDGVDLQFKVVKGMLESEGIDVCKKIKASDLGMAMKMMKMLE